MTGHGLRRRVLQALVSLPTIDEPVQRAALLENTTFAHLRPHVNLSGSTASFAHDLLRVLIARAGASALPRFLDEIATTAPLGADRQEQIGGLADELRGLGPGELDGEFAAVVAGRGREQLSHQCRVATEREISELGTKYMRELYVERGPIELRFDEFLISSATCFLIVSKPGRGKTNMLCRLAEKLQEDRDVLLLSGRTVITDSSGLLSLLAFRLGYGNDWQACFADLATARDPLILLDAINEAPVRPELMREALHELLRQAAQIKVKLVVTCRTDFWQFYRAAFWNSYVWRPIESAGPQGIVARGEDLPPFDPDRFLEVKQGYFTAFGIRGDVVGEAAERCQHPLVLRLFCEAYRDTDVGIVTTMRLYRLLKLFWQRKIEQVADVSSLRRNDAVSRMVLQIARRMRELGRTTVARDEVSAALAMAAEELDRSDSLYSRVLDEEIILEENIDDELGIRNVVFVYDRFAEYVISLEVYADQRWDVRSRAEILEAVESLMADEQDFPTLRGSLEFLVLRLEDRRPGERIHLDIIRWMVQHDWKWRRIGALLVFQLDVNADRGCRELLDEISRDDREFVRRLIADQVSSLVGSNPDLVLEILGKLALDSNRFVREAARRAMTQLPPLEALRAAGTLVATGQLKDASQVVLWAPEVGAQLLEDKLAILAQGDAGAQLWGPVIEHLGSLSAPPWNGLVELEILEELVGHGDRHLELSRQRAVKQALLEATAAQVGRLGDVVDRLLMHVRTGTAGPMPSVSELLGARVGDVLPQAPAQMIEVLTGQPGERESWRRGGPMISWLLHNATDGPLTRRDLPAEAFIQLFLLHREICGQSGAGLAALVARYAPSAGSRERSLLTSIEILVLWVWEAQNRLRRTANRIDELIAQYEDLPESELRDRLVRYEQFPIHHALRNDLEADFIAIARATERNPVLQARVFSPLMVWHEERETTIIDGLLAIFRRRYPDSFWNLLQAVLAHDDQSAVDVVGRAAETAEGTDPALDEVLNGIAEIVEEVAGIDVHEVRLEAAFVDDLDIDSLSMVEIAVQAEDKFGVRIPDDQLVELRTVQDAVDYVLNHR